MKYGRTILIAIGVLSLLVSFTSQAGADIMEFPGLALRINDHADGHGPPDWLKPQGQQIAESKFRYGYTYNRGGLHIVVDIVVDPDPYVTAIFNITNNTGVEKTFTISSLLPISPQILNGSLTSGSVSYTLIDLQGNGATLATDGNTPIYMAKTDGNPFKSLLDDLNVSIPNGTDGIEAIGFGTWQVAPSLAGPQQILNNIGIDITARLSPGDYASIVGSFEVTPEPGTMALLTIGGVTMIMRRRRRRT